MARKSIRRLPFIIFFSCALLHGEESLDSPAPRRITLRHIESGGVGYNTGYTTLETFLSFDPNSWKIAPFFDGRGHLLDDGTWAANGGIGIRGQLGERIYGMNAYYDYRVTKHRNYNQTSIGFETLGRRFDARINGYLPWGRKISTPYDTKFGYFSGHSLFLSEKIELAMKGVDGEIGFHFGNCSAWSFQTAAGPYYFRGSEGPNAWGGKIRLSASYRDWVSFEIMESYDNVFHNNVQGQISLSIPLGKRNGKTRKDNLDCRKIQPVVRHEIIALNHKHKHPIAINPETNSPYFFVFVDNTSSSKGTFESPFPSLLLAQNNSSPHQIIYTFPGDGTTTNMDQGIVLQPSQKFWGSGVSHSLETKQGWITVPQMSAIGPQITNTNLLGVGAILSSHNEISGIAFTETSGNAIQGIDPLDIEISFCRFEGCGQGDLGLYPVLLQSSAPLTANIVYNTFTENTDAGILVKLLPGASSTQIAMNNNQAYNNDANSGIVGVLNIEAHGTIGSCTLVMNDNVFTNNACGGCNIIDFDSPHEGSFASFEGIFTGNTCTGSLQGITFGTNADLCTMTIQGNDLSNNSHGSIDIRNGSAGTQIINQGAFTIDSNQINGGGNLGDAITINPSSNSLLIALTNNSIQNNIGTGFVAFINPPHPNTTLVIENNAIANNQNMANFNAAGGISFDGFGSLIGSIQGNTFSGNAQGNAIGLNGGSFIASPGTSTITCEENQFTADDTFDFEFFGGSPATGCLIISGNTSTTIAPSITYTFQQQGTGACFLVPCDYETKNTGEFNLSGTTTSSDCSGASCP